MVQPPGELNFIIYAPSPGLLNETKKVKNKSQETDGYGRYKRPKTEKLKRKEITITENQKKTETEKKP